MNKLNILINPEIFNDNESRIVLLFMLDLIDNIPGINFIWNEKFYEILFSDKYENAENLYKNNASHMRKLFNRFCCVKEARTEALAEPDIILTNSSIKKVFLKVINTLIENAVSELPLINKDTSHKFKNEQNSKILNTSLTLSMKDYINFAKQDLYDLFWPNTKKDFNYYFSLLITIKELELGYNSINRKYSQMDYSSKFINNTIIFEQSFKDKLIECIVKRLHVSQNEAKRTSLKDEPIVNSDNIRRFYITRDNGRIHYSYSGKSVIKFIELSLDHNRGL